MRLEGIHHITAITGDAPANVDFYVRVLGLRLVKKTVNYDLPEVYHLYYADETGTPGSVLTFFEFPGAPPGRAGAGMVHRITWWVADADSLAFWAHRLERFGVRNHRQGKRLGFLDPEGLGLELLVAPDRTRRLPASAPDIPEEHALGGFAGVRAFATFPQRSERLLGGVLGFWRSGSEYRVEGSDAGAFYAYDVPPPGLGQQGAATVHHIAWACRPQEQAAWRARLAGAGATVTEIIDRSYFRSIYFREASGVLFEIATIGPGFGVDEPIERLGESLTLPPQFEPFRSDLEQRLTPISNPRSEPVGS